jgi:hypothetical protein
LVTSIRNTSANDIAGFPSNGTATGKTDASDSGWVNVGRPVGELGRVAEGDATAFVFFESVVK